MPAPTFFVNFQVGLRLLLEAFDSAGDASPDPWQFAVEIQLLHDAGMSVTNLRWVIEQGYARHAFDFTLAGDERRSFRELQTMKFAGNSTFMLSAAGAEFARSNCLDPTPTVPNNPGATSSNADGGLTASAPKPHWDRSSRRVILEGSTIIELHRAAENLEAALDAFEKSGWAFQIPDPLANKPGNRKRRLHNTINALNRCQTVQRIHYSSADGGRAIRWAVIPSAAPAPSPQNRGG